MSVWSDLKRAMRPADLEDFEWRGLRKALSDLLDDPMLPGEGVRLEVPGVTRAGKAYLLVAVAYPGRLARFEVDHDPDLSAPCFDAYTDFRAKLDREQAAGVRP